jgi:serine/threonine protein kinase
VTLLSAAGLHGINLWPSRDSCQLQRVATFSRVHATSAGLPAPLSPPVGLLDELTRVLEPAFRLDNLVALSAERALYQAWDRFLKRHVALRIHLLPEAPGRAWFVRETETLAALDHPAIRHAYAGGAVGTFAFRTANWIEGESLADALRRGPRPIPTALSLIRDLLSALEHAHARGIIMRRIVPTTLMIDLGGRGIITDLRYSNWCLPHVPASDRVAAYMAPEVRDGEAGEPASDLYTVAANIYAALTGQEPDPDPTQVVPPRNVRLAIPAAVERVILRGLSPTPRDRYFTATEMLEDFVSDAGTFHTPAAAPQVSESGFERRLRRALGDDYELLEEIGAGGFGRVYRARDLDLEREVAIKVLHPSLTADPGVTERFRREAQLAARLRHPNIVSIYDIMGRAGLQWYTMELVPGANLAQVVQRDGPLSVDRAARLLTQALTALEHAHPLGLVHRDLKPENMLIEPDGRLRITDFGLALALRGDARFGGATSRSGTPQFAAPEQLLGERVDQRADLYSLGAVAYFALLGRPPFAGVTPEQILARQTTEDLPALAAERPDVSKELEVVLRHAVASEPARRFPSAAAFREALDRATGGFWRRLRALLQPEG